MSTDEETPGIVKYEIKSHEGTSLLKSEKEIRYCTSTPIAVSDKEGRAIVAVVDDTSSACSCQVCRVKYCGYIIQYSDTQALLSSMNLLRFKGVIF